MIAGSVEKLPGTLAGLVRETPASELPALIGALEAAKAEAWGRLAVPRPAPEPLEGLPALTPEDVAARLALPPSKVYHLLRRRELRGAKLGKYWRVSRAELESYVRQHAGGR